MTVYTIIPLLSTIIYIVLFLVVIFNRPLQKQHKLFLYYLIAATTWSVSNAFLYNEFFMEEKLIIFRVVICSSLWWVVQLYYFARIFMNYNAGIGVKISYGALLVLIILACLGYAPSDIVIENGMFAGPVYGWWFVAYIIPLVFIGAVGIYSLVNRFKATDSPTERNKISYLVVAIILLGIFGFFGITPIAQGGKFSATHIGGLLSAFVLAYSILKHELVSINSVLRRVLGWALLFVVGICSYALVLFLLHLAFDFTLPSGTLVIATLTAALIAVMVYFLRTTFVTMIDYFFYRETYVYRQILQRFDTEMGSIISLDELATKMLSAIVKALNISRAVLLFQHDDSGDFTTRYAFPAMNERSDNELRFVQGNPVITWLEKENNVLNLSRIESIVQFDGLWQEEKELLNHSGLGILYPIKSRGKLVGILALDNKKSMKSYSQEDIEMIRSMAGKAGIIVENARMFATLQKQQEQVQHLLSEAIHAQESERQRISIDLHDSVAQWLAGASYQAQTVEAMLPEGVDDIKEQIALVEDTIERSLKELRRVVVDLRPPALDELGLAHALRQSMGVLSDEDITCQFKEEGTSVRLLPEVEITVYRVVQEAFTNIRKHAAASRVDLSLEYKEDELIVKIQDNGMGFDFNNAMENAVSVGNLGLLGMRQRVEMLGGSMDIRTRRGGGTMISMKLPIHFEQKGNPDEQD